MGFRPAYEHRERPTMRLSQCLSFFECGRKMLLMGGKFADLRSGTVVLYFIKKKNFAAFCIVYTFGQNKNTKSIMYMKKNLLILAAAATLMSCSAPKEEAKTVENPISNIEVSQVIKKIGMPFKCVGDSAFGPDVTVYQESTATIQWPIKVKDNNLKELQDTLMSVALNAKGGDIDSLLVSYAEQALWCADSTRLIPVKRAEMLADSSARIMTQNVNARIIGLSEKAMVYKVEFDAYSGGAHPSYSAQFINYDIQSNQVLDFDDVFKADKQNELFELVKTKLCERYYVKKVADLEKVAGIFVKDLFLTKNIYLNQTSVGFFYNPYEISPWSVGVVEVEIPDYELKDCLTDEAKKLFPIY